MNLVVNLAGTPIGIRLSGKAEKAAPFCESYFRGFLSETGDIRARITVSVLNIAHRERPLPGAEEDPLFEKLLQTPLVAAWLRESGWSEEAFPMGETTVCSFCQGGLLLFDPGTAGGHIFLLREDRLWLQPIHRLLWMYFAQVLAEEGGCFIHAAALARDGEGFLFMGDSGAGKSTLAALSRECTVLSDDGPILRKRAGVYRLFPSPYHQGEDSSILENGGTARGTPLRGLYFLAKNEKGSLEKVTRSRAISRIITRHIHFFPYLSAGAKKALFDLFFEMCHNLDPYELHFNRDQDLWEVITGKVTPRENG